MMPLARYFCSFALPPPSLPLLFSVPSEKLVGSWNRFIGLPF